MLSANQRYFFFTVLPQQVLAIIALMMIWYTQEYIWLIVTFSTWFMTYVMGEGIFLHRYFSHKTFECHPVMAKSFALCAVLGGFGGPISFRAVHLAHHSHSDTPLDPHTPNLGIWHAYMGWYYKPLPKSVNVLLASRQLLKDRYYVWLEHNKTRIWWGVVIFAAIVDLMLCLGFVLGGAIGFHMSSVTNCFLHMVGTRRFHGKDTSRNLWWLSWITWHGSSSLHNNHHGAPNRYHDSHAWYELDVGKWIIPLLASKIVSK